MSCGCRGPMHGPRCGRHGPVHEAPIRRFAEAELLLALAAGRAHGYELIGKVEDLGVPEGSVDLGNVYRTLRAMESEGLVRSEWATSGSGPARREYELTEAGREGLRAWGTALRRTRGSLDRFLEAVDRLSAEGGKTDV